MKLKPLQQHHNMFVQRQGTPIIRLIKFLTGMISRWFPLFSPYLLVLNPGFPSVRHILWMFITCSTYFSLELTKVFHFLYFLWLMTCKNIPVVLLCLQCQHHEHLHCLISNVIKYRCRYSWDSNINLCISSLID